VRIRRGRSRPPRYLVLHSREHLPPGWAERFGAHINWSWVFVLDRTEGDRTRCLFRTRVRVRPWWVAAVYWTAIIPADFVMSRQMLRGIQARAERTTAADLARLASGADRPAAPGSRPEASSGRARQLIPFGPPISNDRGGARAHGPVEPR
jgi:hypothetical protein